jgi:hypothetical protein
VTGEMTGGGGVVVGTVIVAFRTSAPVPTSVVSNSREPVARVALVYTSVPFL